MPHTAFVIMPIRHGEEFEHYRAIYADFVRPTLEQAGYIVTRADDIRRTGAITKDIVLRLSEADVVVADLTDLNANVFYELGIRHVLRKSGTIMLCDKLRTPNPPF